MQCMSAHGLPRNTLVWEEWPGFCPVLFPLSALKCLLHSQKEKTTLRDSQETAKKQRRREKRRGTKPYPQRPCFKAKVDATKGTSGFTLGRITESRRKEMVIDSLKCRGKGRRMKVENISQDLGMSSSQVTSERFQESSGRKLACRGWG